MLAQGMLLATEAPNPASVANDHFQILVVGLVSVLVALIGLAGVLVQTGRRVGRIDEQVSNNHSTNLREEADDRHEANTSKLDSVLHALDELRENDRNLFQLIVGLTRRADIVDERTGQHPLHLQKETT